MKLRNILMGLPLIAAVGLAAGCAPKIGVPESVQNQSLTNCEELAKVNNAFWYLNLLRRWESDKSPEECRGEINLDYGNSIPNYGAPRLF